MHLGLKPPPISTQFQHCQILWLPWQSRSRTLRFRPPCRCFCPVTMRSSFCSNFLAIQVAHFSSSRNPATHISSFFQPENGMAPSGKKKLKAWETFGNHMQGGVELITLIVFTISIQMETGTGCDWAECKETTRCSASLSQRVKLWHRLHYWDNGRGTSYQYALVCNCLEYNHIIIIHWSTVHYSTISYSIQKKKKKNISYTYVCVCVYMHKYVYI